MFWTIINTIALIAAAVFICWQAWETRKSTKYLQRQIRPAAYPLLLRGKDHTGKDKTYLFVRNDSKLKILFNFKVLSKINNCRVQDFRTKPLHVFPGGMSYPNALTKLDDYLEGKVTDDNFKEEEFEIRYEMAFVNNPSLKFRDYLPDEWRFENNHWVGPDGIGPEGVKSIIDNSLKVDVIKMPQNKI